MKLIVFVATLVASAGAANADVPFFSAICPGNIEVQADEGGPVYVNGDEAKLTTFNDNYYEAKSGAVTISLSVNPDGTFEVSYTGKGGANGVCEVADNYD